MFQETWETIQKKMNDNPVALLPVGSIEQHGYHAPLGTDLMIAEAFASNFVKDERTIILPAIPVGVSDYHRHFSGTLWVSENTLRQYTGEIIEALKWQGVSQTIIVNGHGGNNEPLKELAKNLKKDLDVDVVVWTWFKAIEPEIIDFFTYLPPLHADELETSMLLTIKPDLVRLDRIKETEIDGSPVWGEFLHNTLYSTVVKEFSKSGSTGKPTLASAEIGKKFYELALANLSDLVGDLLSINQKKDE
jgi:creatinine amidohydrolase